MAARAQREDTSNAARFLAALAAAFDFNVFKVPVGVQGEYQLALGKRSGRTFLGQDIQTHTLAGGLYYTGQHHLEVGVQGALLLRGEPLIGFDATGNPARTDDIQMQYVQLALRYLW